MVYSVENANLRTHFPVVNNQNEIDQNSTELNLSQRSQEPTETQNTSVPKIETKPVGLGVIDLKQDYKNIERLDPKILDAALLADFPYNGDKDTLKKCSENWELSNKLSELIGDYLPEKFKIMNEFGIKTDSGMIAYLFKNKDSDNGEYRLVFGGTTSGEQFGEFWVRNTVNAKMTLKQWMANVKNLVSFIPKSYKDAHELLCEVIKKYPNDSFSTSGHSKGGAEASYAALKFNAQMVYELKAKEEIFEAALRHEIKTKQGLATNLYKSILRPEINREQADKIINDYKKNDLNKMVKSVNFSSAKLGSAVQKDIVKTFLQEEVDFTGKALDAFDKYLLNKNVTQLISSNISHFYIEGDIVPKFWDITKTKHYGDVKVLSNENPTITKLSEHIDFAQRIEVMMKNNITKKI